MSGTYNQSDVAGRPGNQKRVLVAEGDGFTRLGLILILRDSGLTVDFASNGALALRRLRARTPDALLVEVDLRGLSGVELVKKARKETAFGNLPVFVFTNLDTLSRSVKKELRAYGVKVYDKRSTSMEEVVAHIRSELIQPANGDGSKSTPLQKAEKASSAAKKDLEKRSAEQTAPTPVIDPVHARELEELVTVVCIESEKLMVSPASEERVARCRELCQRVGALWKKAESAGSRNLARQAKVLEAFLGRLCERGQSVAEPALSTVTRAVEVVHSLTCGEPVREALREYKAVVIDEAAESAAAVSDELFKAGFNPVCFNELQQAVEHLSSSPADVIIANLACPELHRLDLPNIRQMALHKNTPVIYASETAALEAFKDLPSTKMPMAHTTPMLVEELVMKALNDVQNTDLPLDPQPASEAAPEASESLLSAETAIAGPSEETESVPLAAPAEASPAESAPVQITPDSVQAPQESVAAPAVFASAEPATFEAGAPGVHDGKRMILFIEDDPFALRIYKKGLKRAGYRVEVAEDGQIALEMLSRSRPDLVVLDLMLPKVNGLEVLEYMRARPGLNNVPVLVLSNGFMDYLAVRAKQAGANRGLSKTECTPTKLVEQVSELLHLHDTVNATRLEDAMHMTQEEAHLEHPDLAAETAIWTRQAGLRKDAPKEVAKIRKVGLTYIKCTDPEARLQYLTDLYRRVRFLSAHAALIGFTKIAEVSSALEGLLFEILVKEAEPTTSTYQTIAQAVDFIDHLVKRDDTSFPEPRTRPRLVVIDDDPGTNEWFVGAIRRGKFEVAGFQDPFDGLRALKDSAFDLVLLQTDIPRLDGFSICEQMRSMPQHASTPVIFIAIGTGFTHRARSIIAGGNDLITQTLSPMELVLRVSMHLLRHQEQASRRAETANDAPPVTWSVQDAEQQNAPEEATPERREVQPDLVGESHGDRFSLEGRTEQPTESDISETENQSEVTLTSDDRRGMRPEEKGAELQPVHADVAMENAAAAEAQMQTAGETISDEPEQVDQPTAELEHLRREFSKQQETLGRYQKERENLMSRIITAENEFHRLEGRVRRRNEKIEKLERQLQELSTEPGTGECPNEPTVQERSATILPENDKPHEFPPSGSPGDDQGEQALRESELARQAAEARCVELEKALADLRQEHEQIGSKLAAERQSASETGNRLRELQDQLTFAEESNRAKEQLEKQITDHDEVENALRARLEEAETAARDSRAAQEQSEAWCAELEKELALLTKARDELAAGITHEQEARARHASRLQELEDSLDQRARELENARNELDSRARTESELRGQLAEAAAASNEIATDREKVQSRCVELEQQLASVSKARDELQLEADKAQNARVETGGRVKVLEEALAQRGQELDRLNNELRTLSEELKGARLECVKHADAESQMRAQLQAAEQAAKEKQAAQNETQAWCVELEKELAGLLQAKEQLEALVAKERQNQSEADKHAKDLEEELRQRTLKLESAESGLQERAHAEAELRAQLETASAALKQSQAGEKQLQARCGKLETEAAALRTSRDELDARLSGQQEAAARVVAQIKEMEGRLDRSAAEHERAKVESGKELDELRKERAKALEQLTNEQRAATELGNRVRELELQLKRSDQELERARSEWENQAKGHAESETALRSRLEAANAAAKQGEAAGKQLQQRCATLEKELAESRQARDQISAQIVKEQKINLDAGKRVQALEKQLKHRTEELKRARTDLEKQAKVHAVAETALQAKTEAAAAAAKQSESAEKQARQRCVELEEEIADLRQARDELNTQFAKEQKLNVDTTKRAHQLEAQLKHSAQDLKRARTDCEKHSRECAEAQEALRRQLEAATQREAELKGARQRGAELEQELAGLRQSFGELDTRFKHEQHAGAEALRRVDELERERQERAKDLQQLNNRLDAQARLSSETVSELRRRLDAATAATQNAEAAQAQTASRCHELEQNLSALRQQHEQLGARFGREQQLSSEAMRSAKLLEQQLAERADELTRTSAELGATRREASELLSQVKAAEEARKQSQSRLHQVQQDIAVAQVELQEMRDKLAREQQLAAEERTQAKELQNQLLAARAEGEARHAEAEHRIREGAAALARVTADLAAERGERQRNEQRVAALNLKLQELHEETRRLLETERAHKQRIVDLDIRVREQRETIDRQTADLEQSQAEQRLSRENLSNARNLNLQFRDNLSALEEANRNLNAAQQDLQSRLETALAALRETESGLQRETADRQALAATLATVRQDLGEQTRKREVLELELQDTVRALREREALLQQESTERQRLSEALGAARLEMRDHSQRTDLEVSKLQQALHSEQLERKRQETEIARMRHSFLDSARGTRSLRNTLRRQVREAVDSMYANTTLFLQLELGEEGKRVAEAILRDVLLVRSRIQEPDMPPHEGGNCQGNTNEPRLPDAELKEEV